MREEKGCGVWIRYKYLNPGPAGPFRGKVESLSDLKKGDTFRWLFGLAEVTSVAKARE